MKKTTKKIAAAAKPAAAKTSAAKAPAVKAPAKKSAVSAARKKSVTVEPPATFISARADIGFGNHLYVRGEGPGLSWDHGIAMDCVAADLWSSTVKGATGPVTFKVLVNDISWSTGNDYVVEPGQSVTIVPTF